MINYKDVETTLMASSWSDESKQELAKILPQMGQALLEHLESRLSDNLSDRSAKQVVEIVSMEPKWYKMLSEQKGYQIKDFILNNRMLLAYDLKAVVAMILDIRNNNGVAGFIGDDLSDIFDALTIDHLDMISSVDVMKLLRDRMLNFAAVTDAMMEIKRYCYLRGIERSDSYEMNKLRSALEGNSEQIGEFSIEVDGSKLKPEIKNWITSYVSQGKKSAGSGIFNVAFFLTQDKVFIAMNKNDQKLLSDILKIYNWFLNPVITSKEVEDYDLARESLFGMIYFHDEPISVIKAGLDLSGANIDRLGMNNEVDISGTSLQKIESAETDVNYNGEARKVGKMRGGLVLDRKTNIVMADEEKRMSQDREDKKASIESMLADLRKRNKK